MVRLAGSLRFAGIDIGATSIDVAVTDGELKILGHVSEPCDVRDGPVAVLNQAMEMVGKLRDQGYFTQLHGAGIGVPGPVSFREGMPVAPPLMPGWDRYPVRETVGRSSAVPPRSTTTSTSWLWASSTRGWPSRWTTSCSSRSAPGSAAGSWWTARSTGASPAVPATSATSASTTRAPPAPAATSAALRPTSEGPPWPGRPRPSPGVSPYLGERLRRTGTLTGEDVAAAAEMGDAEAVRLIRDGGRRVGTVLAGLVSFFNPGLVIIAGGVAKLGHVLLAEIRSVVYRRSLPLATGNLPIVLSELGADAGVIGAARLSSDHVFSAP